MKYGFWTAVSLGVLSVRCSHLAQIPPQLQIAAKVIEAPDGIDISFDGRACHAKDWTEAWIALGKMIRKDKDNVGINCSPKPVGNLSEPGREPATQIIEEQEKKGDLKIGP